MTMGTLLFFSRPFWITDSIPPDTTVLMEAPKLKYR